MTAAGPLAPVAAEVVVSRPLGGYQVLSLSLPALAAAPRPGQLVLATPGDRPLLQSSGRPVLWWISGSETERGFGSTLECVVRPGPGVPGTGERVGLLGPLGRAFTAPTQAVPVLVVGHEVGGAVARWWSRLLGARGVPAHLVLCADDPDDHVDPVTARRAAASVTLTTPDELAAAVADLSASTGAAAVYAVTPTALSAQLAEVAGERGLAAQVTVLDDAVLACGLGLCGGCEVPVRAAGRWVRPCVDGPVLRADLVDWARLRQVSR